MLSSIFSFCIFSIILFFYYPQVFLTTVCFAVKYFSVQPISIIPENSSNNSLATKVLSPPDYFPVSTRSFTNNLCSCYVFHLQISVLNIFPSQYVPIPSIFSFTNISPSSIFLHSPLPIDIFFSFRVSPSQIIYHQECFRNEYPRSFKSSSNNPLTRLFLL